jgi:hypothetical protein
MTCSATKFTDKSLPGIILPGSAENTKINVAGYTIFPSIISQATTGEINAQQYLDSFDAYFLPRYFISNIRHDKKIGYTVTNYNDECPGISGYSSFGFSGVYAASGDKITIVYSISDKFNLMKDGKLRVKIYSNQVVDLDGTMDMIYNTIMSAQAKGGGDLGPFFSSSPTNLWINVKIPDKTIIDSSNGASVIIPQYSEIDTWRNFVAQNTLDKIRASNISNTIVSDFYSNPKEWVLAKQFSAYDIVLNIVNGKATLNLDASDVVSLIFIEASYEFANGQMEVVRGDMLVYANPLNVSGPNPCSITMVDDTTTYEIGFNVTWMGEKIQENVRLNCTGVTPSTSITTNGIAKGMRIGPHQLFYQDKSSECTTIDERTLSIDVSSVTGYTYNCSRKFDWIAMQPEENANNFYFKVSQGNPAWADGDISSLASVSSYLFDGFNDVDPVWPLLPCKGYYYIGEDCLLLENRIVNVFPNFDCSVENAKIIPQSSKWVNGRVSFSQTPININVGNPPLGETVDMVTSYQDQNGKMFIGSGTVKDPECDVEHGGVKSFPPKFLYKEPLGIKTYLETKNGVFNRDILVPANVVSVITWKDDFLKETFTFNRGTPQETTMPYPFPIVSFATGIGSVKNSFPIDAPPRDPRCPPYGWLVITSSPEISLSNYSAKVGLFRTSIANVNSVSHTHSCEVDSYGNGLTYATISLSTVDTINHIHTISNFVVDSTITHSHTLQSVAITQIQPTTNRTDDISINAYVPYDPTGASPQSCFDPSYYPYPEGNNRLMYDTLTLPIGLPTAPSLQLCYSAENKVSSPEPIITASQSQPGASFLVAEYPGDTENGFDIKASVWISEYRTWNEATSSYDYHPPVLVPDGTRVTFSLDCYLPKKSASEQSSIKIFAPDIAN